MLLVSALFLLVMPGCGTPLSVVSDPSSPSAWAAETPGPGFMDPTSNAVLGHGCAWTAAEWNGSAGPLLFDRWASVGTLRLGDLVMDNPEALQTWLARQDPVEAERAALTLNLAMESASVFGVYADLHHARLAGGDRAGLSPNHLLDLADRSETLLTDLLAFNEGFGGCDAEWYRTCDSDLDNDGVPATLDCDDLDPIVGTELYQDDLSRDDAWFSTTPALSDPWSWSDSAAIATEGGQQALLGASQSWSHYVVYAQITSRGPLPGCGDDPTAPCDDRWRAGVLARASLDADQDEGYHGYRCALAHNAVDDCYPEGAFLQIAAFMDKPEDDIASECAEECEPNTTFNQLARTDHPESLDLAHGSVASLAFWVVEDTLLCDVRSGSIHVRAQAHDASFAAGTTGFSTLDMAGEYQDIRVCEAYDTP